MLAMGLRKLDGKLRKPLNRVIREVRQPRVLCVTQSACNAEFVLIDLPGNTRVFQALGEGGPAGRPAEIYILVTDICRRTCILLLANRSAPKVEAVGSRACQ